MTRGDLTPRPTIYQGVAMRSRLEAAWAEQFDALGWGWDYEPFALAGPVGQYLPDFLVRIPGADPDKDLFVEVKGGGWVNGGDKEVAQVERMRELVTTRDRPSVLAIFHTFADRLTILVYPPASRDSRMRLATIVKCEDGCTGIVETLGTVCDPHERPWHPVELVASVHAEPLIVKRSQDRLDMLIKHVWG